MIVLIGPGRLNVNSTQPEKIEIIAFEWKIDSVNFSERSFV